MLAAGTRVSIPWQVVHGALDGPTLCLEGTLHGWEPMGAEIIRRAMQEVDPTTLRGTVLCLPLANPLSVEFGGTIESGGLRVNPLDSLDLNRVWPGRAEGGWLTETMAHRMWTEFVSRSDYLVDYHDGTAACDGCPSPSPGISGRCTPEEHRIHGCRWGWWRRLRDAGRHARIRRLHERPDPRTGKGVRVVGDLVAPGWREPRHDLGPGHAPWHRAARGRSRGRRRARRHNRRRGVCTLNVMRHLGMIEGEPVLPERQIMVDEHIVVHWRPGL